MCGICGIYSDKLSVEEKTDLITRMIQTMGHRGPDGFSIFVENEIAIANARLAIVDISCDKQIFWNEDSTIAVTFNGEIYNHKELREYLQKNHTFSSNTDSEVIVHLYEEFGPRAISRLKGDFAFAIWDALNKKVFLVRDRVGVKPLYYGEFDKGVVFASEIRAIKKIAPNLAELDYDSIYHYLTYRFVPGPKTAFKRINKLSPGYVLSMSENERISVQKYWDFPLHVSSEDTDESSLVKRGISLLESAVLDRIPAEVEYGILLSGGLDSSLITAIAAKNSPKPIRTYSIVFLDSKVDTDSSEHINSRLVSNIYTTIHTELSVSAEAYSSFCLKTVRFLEEPVADPSSVLLGLISEAASSTVKVLLSGEGADELFGGYFIYPELIKDPDSYTGMGRLLVDDQKNLLLSPEYKAILGNAASMTLIKSRTSDVHYSDPLSKMLYIDCKYWLVDDLLLKADKMGMMNSVEIRVPYLDDRFINFAYSLPSTLKIKFEGGNCYRKYLLRKIADMYLPVRVVQQPKRGFPLPLGTWLRGELKEWALETLKSLLNRKYFDRAKFNQYTNEYFHRDTSSFKDHVIWSFIVLELFHQELIDG